MLFDDTSLLKSIDFVSSVPSYPHQNIPADVIFGGPPKAQKSDGVNNINWLAESRLPWLALALLALEYKQIQNCNVHFMYLDDFVCEFACSRQSYLFNFHFFSRVRVVLCPAYSCQK